MKDVCIRCIKNKFVFVFVSSLKLLRILYRCQTCGYEGYPRTDHVTLQKELRGMEERLSQQISSQIQNLHHHFDSRINQMFAMVTGFGGGGGGKQVFDYTEPSTSAV